MLAFPVMARWFGRGAKKKGLVGKAGGYGKHAFGCPNWVTRVVSKLGSFVVPDGLNTGSSYVSGMK